MLHRGIVSLTAATTDWADKRAARKRQRRQTERDAGQLAACRRACVLRLLRMQMQMQAGKCSVVLCGQGCGDGVVIRSNSWGSHADAGGCERRGVSRHTARRRGIARCAECRWM